MIIMGVRSSVEISESTTQKLKGYGWRCQKCRNTAGYPVKGIDPNRTSPFKSKEDAVRAATAHANVVCPG